MKQTNTILDEIVENKKKEVDVLKNNLSLEEIKKKLSERKSTVRNFSQAISDKGRISLIAEIKKASPSHGVLTDNFDPKAIARKYEESQVVDAISVLTDKKYFQGDISSIEDVKEVTTLPVLRKDFIIDEYQIYESFFAGADAILLIVGCLEQNELGAFYNTATGLGMECVVEVHTEEELKMALHIRPQIIGVNARDLRTFSIDKTLANSILSDIPKEILKVAESGIEMYQDILDAYHAGAQAVLVGSAIMKAENIEEKLHELKGEAYVPKK